VKEGAGGRERRIDEDDDDDDDDDDDGDDDGDDDEGKRVGGRGRGRGRSIRRYRDHRTVAPTLSASQCLRP